MQVIFMIIVLVMSVVIHEVSHGYVAYALGDPTAKLAGRLTLNPLSHLDFIGSIVVPAILALSAQVLGGGFIIGWAKPVPYNPDNLRNKRWGPALVAIAGPGSNILLVLIFTLILRLGMASSFFTSQTASLLALIVLINLALAIFNLLPVPPLDGSKIILALFSPLSARRLENLFYRYQWVLFIILLFVVMNTNFLGNLINGLFTLLVG